MSDVNNPYQSPEAAVSPVKPLVSQGTLTETMLVHLKTASPWLRFMGVLGFIGAGFCVLGGFLCLAFLPAATTVLGASDELGVFATVFSSFGPAMVLYALYFIGLGVVAFFPARFTYNFGAKIRNYLLNGAEPDLETALKNNAALWKFNGIVAIIGLAFVPVLTIIATVAAVAISMNL